MAQRRTLRRLCIIHRPYLTLCFATIFFHVHLGTQWLRYYLKCYSTWQLYIIMQENRVLAKGNSCWKLTVQPEYQQIQQMLEHKLMLLSINSLISVGRHSKNYIWISVGHMTYHEHIHGQCTSGRIPMVLSVFFTSFSWGSSVGEFYMPCITQVRKCLATKYTHINMLISVFLVALVITVARYISRINTQFQRRSQLEINWFKN